LSGFLLPFIIVYGNALLGLGAWYEILWASLTALMGVWALSVALVGYYQARISTVWRCLLAGTALMLIFPGLVTDLLGFSVLLIFLFAKTSLLKRKVPSYDVE
jgi:TRAP-type uncharacterized transport system fused permease subunit